MRFPVFLDRPPSLPLLYIKPDTSFSLPTFGTSLSSFLARPGGGFVFRGHPFCRTPLRFPSAPPPFLVCVPEARGSLPPLPSVESDNQRLFDAPLPKEIPLPPSDSTNFLRSPTKQRRLAPLWRETGMSLPCSLLSCVIPQLKRPLIQSDTSSSVSWLLQETESFSLPLFSPINLLVYVFCGSALPSRPPVRS